MKPYQFFILAAIGLAIAAGIWKPTIERKLAEAKKERAAADERQKEAKAYAASVAATGLDPSEVHELSVLREIMKHIGSYQTLVPEYKEPAYSLTLQDLADKIDGLCRPGDLGYLDTSEISSILSKAATAYHEKDDEEFAEQDKQFVALKTKFSSRMAELQK